jgi:ubiquinone/menaquinone biosynthesis C-methylase UbiE
MSSQGFKVDFRCPECHGSLKKSDDSFVCKNCQAEWPLRGSIPCFLPQDVYWADLPQEVMNQILIDGEKRGGKDGLAQVLRQRCPELFAHTFDPRRADWRLLLKTSNQGMVLDAGCGLGALSIPLAKDNLGVVSLDSTHERVKFVKIRCQQEGIHNVQPVCASVLSLPFPDYYFDVVVVNAVLEWLGLSDEEKSPQEVQIHGLEELRRVLKPGGELYLATKNRYAYFYWLGKKDPHSELRWITLLPRWLGQCYSKLFRRKDYREYLYSYHQYRKLISSVGFSKIDVYASFPSFRNFSHMFPLGQRQAVQSYLERFFDPRFRLVKFGYQLVRHLKLNGVIKYFVPDFSIVARR